MRSALSPSLARFVVVALACTALVGLGPVAAPPALAADVVLVPPTMDFTPNRAITTPVAACGGTVRCVGPGATYSTIGAAVTAAISGDTIQVAAGTYAERVSVTGKELTLLGGFAAGFAARNPVTNVTTINGQLGGTTLTLSDAGDSVIDGFRIIGGAAPLDEFDRGAGSGIRVDISGEVTISHNLIENNDDGNEFDDCNNCVFGGGIAVTSYLEDSSALITDNVIRNNRAVIAAAVSAEVPVTLERNLISDNHAGGDHGGGLFLSGDGSVLRQNLFDGNTIGDQAGYGWGGGGIFVGSDSTTRPTISLEANRWVGNSAPLHGSAFFVDEAANAVIVGDLFHDNVCTQDGAGLYLDGGAANGSRATVENVTITHHTCPAGSQGTGILIEGGSRLDLVNSIVIGNGGISDITQCDSCQATPPSTASTTAYSLLGPVNGSVTNGVGVIGGQPGFVNAVGGDFHLATASAAIDRANPASTVGAEPAPNGARRNLGTYGGTIEATVSGGQPVPTPAVVSPTWPTKATFGKPLQIPVSVSSEGVPATGMVRLRIGSAILDDAPLIDGAAMLATIATQLQPGPRSLILDYLGSATVDPGTATQTVVIAKAIPGKPAMRVTKKPTSRKAGIVMVRVPATVSGVPVSGRVTLSFKGPKKAKPVSGTLANGQATLPVRKLKKGKWRLTATYSGDAHYLASTSNPVTLKVKK